MVLFRFKWSLPPTKWTLSLSLYYSLLTWCRCVHDWRSQWGGDGNRCGGDCHWSGRMNDWGGGDCDRCSHSNRCGGGVDGRIVTDLRGECVSVDVGGLANDLVADLSVANNGVSGLDCLQYCGRRCDCVHRWRLRY